MRPKKVHIVGAGPGDPSLLTIKAVQVLQNCDIVLYDRLIDPRILEYAKGATCIDIGKKVGQGQSLQNQESINQQLILYSQNGFKVVRLKGGDPFIFGRGGEEALALAQAQIPFEIVPGISSCYAAPGAVGIPLTHRQVASGFGVYTAHRAGNKKNLDIDWEIAAKLPTVVFLMGVQNLSEIIAGLVRYGRSLQTPVAIISRATLTEQLLAIGVLENIEEKARVEGICSPATIVVGEVVKLHSQIMLVDTWHEDQQYDEELELALRGEVLAR